MPPDSPRLNRERVVCQVNVHIDVNDDDDDVDNIYLCCSVYDFMKPGVAEDPCYRGLSRAPEHSTRLCDCAA